MVLVPISLIGNHAFIFNLEHLKYLRETLNILGNLSGTLPIAPQQSLFLSLPLQLSIEEVLTIVLSGHGYLVVERQVLQQFVQLWGQYQEEEKYLQLIWDNNVKEIIKRKKDSIDKKLKAIETNIEKLNSKSNKNDKDLLKSQKLQEVKLSILTNLNDFKEDDYKLSTFIIPNTVNEHFPFSGNYNWIVDNFQKKPEIQRKILISYIKNYFINENSIHSKPMNDDNSYSSPLKTVECPTLSSTMLPKMQKLLIALNFIIFLKSSKVTKNYFISPGLKFGNKFIVYPGDPLRYHSHLITGFYDYYNEDIGLINIVAGGRLAVGVKKLFVVSGMKSHKKNKYLEEKTVNKCFTEYINELQDDFTSLNDKSKISDKEVVNYSIEWAGFG